MSSTLLGEAEGKERGGGEKGRGAGFTWCESELKTIEERTHVKRICTPRNIGGKPLKIQSVGIFGR